MYSAQQLVYQAAIIGAAAKVGLGGLLTAFKSGTATDGAAVLEKNIRRVNEAGAGREYMHAIHQHLQSGEAGLAWLTPLSFDMEAGLQECIRSYKNDAVLLTLYATTPITALRPCFSSGVDMHNAIFGYSITMNSNEYAQLFISQLACGSSVTCLCEKATRQELTVLQPTVTRLREWQPVATFVRFCAGMTGSETAHTTPPRAEQREAMPLGGRTEESVAASTIDVPQPEVDTRQRKVRMMERSSSENSRPTPEYERKVVTPEAMFAPTLEKQTRQRVQAPGNQTVKYIARKAGDEKLPVAEHNKGMISTEVDVVHKATDKPSSKVSWATQVEEADDNTSVETVKQVETTTITRHKKSASDTKGTTVQPMVPMPRPMSVQNQPAHTRTIMLPLSSFKRDGVVARPAPESPATQTKTQRMLDTGAEKPRVKRIEQVDTTDKSLITRSKTELAEVEDESVTLDGLSI